MHCKALALETPISVFNLLRESVGGLLCHILCDGRGLLDRLLHLDGHQALADAAQGLGGQVIKHVGHRNICIDPAVSSSQLISGISSSAEGTMTQIWQKRVSFNLGIQIMMKFTHFNG